MEVEGVGEGGVAVNFEKNTIFPEHPVRKEATFVLTFSKQKEMKKSVMIRYANSFYILGSNCYFNEIHIEVLFSSHLVLHLHLHNEEQQHEQIKRTAIAKNRQKSKLSKKELIWLIHALHLFN